MTIFNATNVFADISQAYKTVNQVSEEWKAVKCTIRNEGTTEDLPLLVVFAVEAFFSKPDDFKGVFKRMLSAVNSAIEGYFVLVKELNQVSINAATLLPS